MIRKKLYTVGILAALIFGLFGGLLAIAQGRAVNADGIDEIVTIDQSGYVVVYNYLGAEIFKSAENGWSYIATGDLNNDGDDEIVAISASSKKIKVYNPAGAAYSFETTYTAHSGTFKQVGVGKLVGGDAQRDIAILMGVDATHSRMIIYTPPNAAPQIDYQYEVSNWDRFAIGDFDGDGDDDFVYTYWNASYPSNFKSWLEVYKGHSPGEKLNGDATIYNESQWFDIAAGNFKNDSKMEWFGSQNLWPHSAAQEWNKGDDRINILWRISDKFDRLAAANFRGNTDGTYQAAMLRTADGVLKFAGESSSSPGTGVIWATANAGSGWLDVAAGNLDNEALYKEAIIVKSNLLRIYLITQSPSEYLDCVPHDNNQEECVEIEGSFNGQIATGDVGVFTDPPDAAEAFAASPSTITRTPAQSTTIATQTLYIRGEKNISDSIIWAAAILPEPEVQQFQEMLSSDANLSFSITAGGIEYANDAGSGQLPPVTWINLDYYTGTTPSTITVAFSDTFAASPLFDEGLHKATILIYRESGLPPEDRFRYVDVFIMVNGTSLYLPLVLK